MQAVELGVALTEPSPKFRPIGCDFFIILLAMGKIMVRSRLAGGVVAVRRAMIPPLPPQGQQK